MELNLDLLQLNDKGMHVTAESAQAMCDAANSTRGTFDQYQVVEREHHGDFTIWPVCAKLPGSYRPVK